MPGRCWEMRMPNDMKNQIEITAAQRDLFFKTLDQMAKKVAEDEPTLGVEFPHVTAPDGSWIRLPASLSAGYTGSSWSHGNWLCGFWVGLLLASYRHTNDQKYLVWARERMRLVAQRAEDPNTHDIGFIFDSSAIRSACCLRLIDTPTIKSTWSGPAKECAWWRNVPKIRIHTTLASFSTAARSLASILPATAGMGTLRWWRPTNCAPVW